MGNERGSGFVKSKVEECKNRSKTRGLERVRRR